MDLPATPDRRTFLKSTLLAAAGVAGGAALRAEAEPLRFGVNYIPRKHWVYCWQDWDLPSVREDFKAIRELGLDHIRAHWFWPLAQPGLNYVSERMLDQVNALLDAAEEAGLAVQFTVLNGWMGGGYPTLPGWVGPSSKRNLFTHPEAIEAEKFLFSKMAAAIGGRRSFRGFDLGNELSMLAYWQPLTERQADEWCAAMFGHLGQVSPGKFHVNGLDHRVWWSDWPFSRGNMNRFGAASVVHSYAFWSGSLQRYGYSGVGTLHLVEYNVELAYAYHTDPARRVWVAEVGASLEWMPANYLQEYITRVLTNTASTGHLWGATWWCSHDIDPGIKGFKSMEYTLGLLDQRNRPKPMGRYVASAMEALRAQHFPETDRPTALVIPDRGLSTKGDPPDWTYATAFMTLVAKGIRPCIVLHSRAGDEAYLRSRGIKDLIPVNRVV